MRMSEGDWDTVLDTNLKGAFLMTKGFFRVFAKQRSGRVINISSVIGLMGNAGQANYAASKAGLIGLTQSTAREFASRGVTVNAIAPGFIETDMTELLKPETIEAILKQIPLARLGAPDDVASVVAFLCSEGAAYVQGEVISIDGGLFM